MTIAVVTYGDERGEIDAYDELTAAEAAVLIGDSNAGQALKLAMFELIARGWMSLAVAERRGRFGRRHEETLVVVTPGVDPPSDPVLGPPFRIVLATPEESHPDGRTGRPLADVVQSAVAEWQGAGGFSSAVVTESLVSRGLLAQTTKKWLGLVPRTVTELTPRGETLAARIAADLERLLSLPQAVRDDLRAAAAYAGAQNRVTILLGASGPDRRKLDDAFRRIHESTGDGGPAMTWYWGLGADGSDTGERVPGRTFDELSSAWDSLDTGVDSGSGGWGDSDGGGDGGGD